MFIGQQRNSMGGLNAAKSLQLFERTDFIHFKKKNPIENIIS